MRSGIAFFSTIMIMAVVSLLVTLSMDSLFFVQKSERDKRYIAEESVLLYDSYAYLNKVLKEPMSKLKENYQKEVYLREILMLPLFIEIPDSSVAFEIRLENKEGLPNINSLSDINFRENFFIEYLTLLKVKDPALFSETFFPSVEENELKIEDNSTVSVAKSTSRKITDLEEFYNILGAYAKKADDKAVFDVNWERSIRFEGERGLNMNYINALVTKALPVHLSQYDVDRIAKHEEVYANIRSMGIEDEDDIAKMQKISPSFRTRVLNVSLNVILPYRTVLYKFLYNIDSGTITELKVYR